MIILTAGEYNEYENNGADDYDKSRQSYNADDHRLETFRDQEDLLLTSVDLNPSMNEYYHVQ